MKSGDIENIEGEVPEAHRDLQAVGIDSNMNRDGYLMDNTWFING